MSRCWVTFVLLALAAFCRAKRVEGKRLLQPIENPALEAWTVFGVVATTTLSVVIILVPTLLYYKYYARSKATSIDLAKKINI